MSYFNEGVKASASRVRVLPVCFSGRGEFSLVKLGSGRVWVRSVSRQ
ncbi:hypothetical protein [Caldivirga sp. UBA161]|nr:hypothetical protein [Caldivirga sp. UBA161]